MCPGACSHWDHPSAVTGAGASMSGAGEGCGPRACHAQTTLAGQLGLGGGVGLGHAGAGLAGQ